MQEIAPSQYSASMSQRKGVLASCMGVKAAKEFTEMQPGDVVSTFADISLLKALTDFKPQVSVETGISNFVNWYKEYYKQN